MKLYLDPMDHFGTKLKGVILSSAGDSFVYRANGSCASIHSCSLECSPEDNCQTKDVRIDRILMMVKT